MPPYPLSIDLQSKFFEGNMSVTVQIEDEDLAFIYETLVKLRDERKKEAQRIEKILKELEEATKKRNPAQKWSTKMREASIIILTSNLEAINNLLDEARKIALSDPETVVDIHICKEGEKSEDT